MTIKQKLRCTLIFPSKSCSHQCLHGIRFKNLLNISRKNACFIKCNLFKSVLTEIKIYILKILQYNLITTILHWTILHRSRPNNTTLHCTTLHCIILCIQVLQAVFYLQALRLKFCIYFSSSPRVIQPLFLSPYIVKGVNYEAAIFWSPVFPLS